MVRRLVERGSAVLLLGALAGCVGSEPADRTLQIESDAEDSPDAPAVVEVGVDTVSPVAYQVFERTALGTGGDRAMFRVLVLVPAAPEALAKTLRIALDSLGRADSKLVAARAVLYTARPTGALEARLVPRAWGEWVPPEGWEAANGSARKRYYRTNIYLGDPGWSQMATGAVDERS